MDFFFFTDHWPLTTDHLFAQEFPRGPGLYFNPFKFVIVVAVYLAWVRTCWWVNQDCRENGLPTARWNPLLLAGGFLGLVLVWGLPFFWLSLLVLVTLYLAPTLIYIGTRNEMVSDDQKVLTPRHLRYLANRYLGLKGGKHHADEKKKLIPVRFIGKSSDAKGDDATRVRRAQESQYYRAALEVVYEAVSKRATDIHLEPTK